jgi:PAS domain S-box-containing protein
MEQIATEILESMPDAFTALDREWRYTHVNGAAEHLTGFRRDEMIGRTQWEISHEIIGPQFDTVCRRAMDERVTGSCEEYLATSGTWFQETAYPSPDGITVCARDVTKRKCVEEGYEPVRNASGGTLNSG